MKLVYIIIIISLTFVFCKKNQQNNSSFNEQIAQFYYTPQCGINNPSQGIYVDSFVSFENSSYLKDTSDRLYNPAITYKWSFGDQSSSTEKNPIHKYTNPGTYTVTLHTYINNQFSDSTSKQLFIIIGLREFDIDYDNGPIDVDEAAGKGAIILFIGHSSTSTVSSFGIFMVDSLLNTRWISQIPGDENSVRLNSIKKTNDNGYILSGNYLEGNTNQFCISKIGANGNLLWMKYIDNLTGKNFYTTPVSDGGYITLGYGQNSVFNYTVMVKCDENGNELWRKSFDSTSMLFGAENIIEIDSGYVFAACSIEAPSNIILTKLDFNGNIIGQMTRTPDYPLGGSTPVGIDYSSNIFFVYLPDGSNPDNIYFFNRDLSPASIPTLTKAISGSFIDNDHLGYYNVTVGQTDIGVLENNGTTDWDRTINNIDYTGCNTSTGAYRVCVRAIYTSSNEIIGLSFGTNENNSQSIYLVKLTPDGKVK